MHIIREADIIEEDHRPRQEFVVVEEGLVRDGPLQAVCLREEPEHRVAGMGLPLAGVPGDGDVQAAGVCHRL